MELLDLCLASLPAVTPERLWGAWSFAPQTLLGLAAVLLLYPRALKKGQRAAFMAGWLVLALALVSPLCRLAATLVSAHMVQHVLLVAVAPLLLALGAPLRRPPPPSILLAGAYGLAIWLWHFPPVYAAVLLDATVHTLAYAALIALSYAFWASVLAGGWRALPMLFGTLVHTGVLSALLTFSGRAWYPLLAEGAPHWNLTPLLDQQLAGLIMWVPMGAVYLGCALAVAARSLSDASATSAMVPAMPATWRAGSAFDQRPPA